MKSVKTGAGLKRARNILGLSKAALAKELYLPETSGVRNISAWEGDNDRAAQKGVPGPIRRCVELLLEKHHNGR